MALSINGEFGSKNCRVNEKTALLYDESSISKEELSKNAMNKISGMIIAYFNQKKEDKKTTFNDLNLDVAVESENLTDEDKKNLYDYLKTEKLTDKDGDNLINSLKKLDSKKFPGVKDKINKIKRLTITIDSPESAYSTF